MCVQQNDVRYYLCALFTYPEAYRGDQWSCSPADGARNTNEENIIIQFEEGLFGESQKLPNGIQQRSVCHHSPGHAFNLHFNHCGIQKLVDGLSGYGAVIEKLDFSINRLSG